MIQKAKFPSLWAEKLHLDLFNVAIIKCGNRAERHNALMPNLSAAQKTQKKCIFCFEKDMKGGAVEMPRVSGPVRPQGPRLISS